MEMEEIDFAGDGFDDIVAKDSRYDARAYALLMDCVHFLGKEDRHMTAADIMDEFKERTLDQYGAMSMTVLSEWGLRSTEDLGEMMFNLSEHGRVRRDPEDTAECFVGGYDFEEAFLGPYRA